MFGRRFWSTFSLTSFWRYQQLKFLLLGIAVVSFTLVWVSSASALMSVYPSNVKAELSSTTQCIRQAISNKGDAQDSCNQGYESSNPQVSSARIIAALEGYDVRVHGFAFENYGNEKNYWQLTPTEVERMFGERVCLSKINDECILTPLGEQWMKQKNEIMGNGHCDGMAALSLLFYLNQLKVEDFGGSSVNSLQLEGNQRLQREIAYWWATQATEPTRSARDKNELTPREVSMS
jgi:hypothetical protein